MGKQLKECATSHVFGKHHQWNCWNWLWHNSQDQESAIDILDAYACVEGTNVSDCKQSSEFLIRTWNPPFCGFWKPGDRRNYWSRNCRQLWTRVSGRSWISEVILNKELWGSTYQRRLEESIKRRKWKWTRHMLRKLENNINRFALEWNPQGLRRRDRPKHSWRRRV